jgi:hypothetical protein
LNKNKPRVIAFYLPQFHPIAENDAWWGNGFTEWTNVGKAKPLFRGHYQPRVPADLGYYDLRIPEVREAQAKLAKEAGVEGFMYWHYWFGNGKRLMENIFEEVLESGKPDLPFCLGWANHSWFAKNWNSSCVLEDKLLIEQFYPGENDFYEHFKTVLKAFKDERYIKVGNKPVFLIFDQINLPENFIPLWDKWAKQEGFNEGLYFVANVNKSKNQSKKFIIDKGFSAVTYQKMGELYNRKNKFQKLIFHIIGNINNVFFNKPLFTFDYKKSFPLFVSDEEYNEDVIPFMLPNWDHTPRSGKNGTLLNKSTPELFKEHAHQVINILKEKENKLIFLKSWNEWAEGNYMEPDLKHGKGYLKALREVIDNHSKYIK